MKYRTTTIGVSWVTARKGWGDAALVLEQQGDVAKRVVIEISDPNELAYLRERLDDIENDWKRRMASLHSS